MAKKESLSGKNHEELNKMIAESEAKPDATQVTIYHDDGSIWYQAMRGGHGDRDFVRHHLNSTALPVPVTLYSDAINRFEEVAEDWDNELDEVRAAYDAEIHKLCADGETINVEDYDNAAVLMYDFAYFLQEYEGREKIRMSWSTGPDDIFQTQSLEDYENWERVVVNLSAEAADKFRGLAQSAPSVYDHYVVDSLDLKANALISLERFDEAEKVLKEAFDICRTDAAKFGPIDWTAHLVLMYEEMGSLYRTMGNEKEAIAYYEEGWRTFYTSGQEVMRYTLNFLVENLSELYEQCGMTQKLEKLTAEWDELRK